MQPVEGINQTEQSLPAAAISIVWGGMPVAATAPRTPWDRSVPTNWAFTICRATCLNGVRIGMAVTAAPLRRIPKALPPVLVVCSVGVVGAAIPRAAPSRAAATATLTTGTTISGCASPSPIYNEDLLRRKRRTKNARKHSACRPEGERNGSPTRQGGRPRAEKS